VAGHISRRYLVSRHVTGKNFTGYILCGSEDSVTHLIHILLFLTISNYLYKPQKNKSTEVKSEERGNQKISPLLLSTDKETPVLNVTNMTGEVG
jgi:hypothetical protein